MILRQGDAPLGNRPDRGDVQGTEGVPPGGVHLPDPGGPMQVDLDVGGVMMHRHDDLTEVRVPGGPDRREEVQGPIRRWTIDGPLRARQDHRAW